MATVNFLYRSTKNSGNLVLRLLYRHDNKDFVIGAKTQFEVSKEYWTKQHNLKRPKDIDIINKQTQINTELNKIENHVLDAFKKTNALELNKSWLQTQIDHYYNPTENKELSKELVKYIDNYVEFKRTEVTESTIKKCNVIKQLLIRYQISSKKIVLLTDVDTIFKRDFENYCISHQYSSNTTARALRFIKTICNHAKFNGLATSHQLDNIKAKYTKVDSIYLTFNELERIENTTLNERLENAKDWLIISCYLGQRVSDFMTFTEKQIRIEKGKSLIEFTQKKTGKVMTVPLHSKVLEILAKRNGKFPHSISDQKYNDYIKEVCKLAGLTEKIVGSKKTETEPNSKVFRNEAGTFEKWELVTSHIGRRSFATNFYGTIPTTYLIYVTGHSTETMFLNYIGKSNKDLAMELTNYF